MMVIMIPKIIVDNDEEDHSQSAGANMLKAQITQRAAATQAKAGQCVGWEKLEIQGEGLVRYLQLHLHQEDSVMVGEDLVYSLTVTLL